jgi:pimeloyl-ACP methyl ester carboxylesterase
VDLIGGAEDRLIDAADIAQAHRLLRVARADTITGCGHWPWLEKPSELVEFILSRRTDGGPKDHDA